SVDRSAHTAETETPAQPDSPPTGTAARWVTTHHTRQEHAVKARRTGRRHRNLRGQGRPRHPRWEGPRPAPPTTLGHYACTGIRRTRPGSHLVGRLRRHHPRATRVHWR